MQRKEAQWAYQWSRFQLDDENVPMIREWMAPWRPEDLSGKTVLDCGCGQGQHAAVLAAWAREVVGVDLNTAELARRRVAGLRNARIIEGDIAELELAERFDFVYCMGVLHHTEDPERSFRNVARLLKPGGVILFCVYSREGNLLNRVLLEPAKRVLLSRLDRDTLLSVARAANAALGLLLDTLYRLPLPLLPFYDYLRVFRGWSRQRRLLTVFDMLNAPRAAYLPRETVERWLRLDGLSPVHLSRLKGVCWRGSARLDRHRPRGYTSG
ncbi:MAG: class I SAM-dependent methyltransferase [Elusimicrobia bacterium]|nr:class I SAM-dependent methyltransferase [Elusimicrobiota bacterium]